MARPRNEELYCKIKQAAYDQLLTVGFENTTYRSIADACGVARTAVQNYYPSKTALALSFFEDLLTAIRNSVNKNNLHQDSEFDTMFCIGQSFFMLLMSGRGARKLLLDLTSSRDITSDVLNFEYAWGVEFLSPGRTVTNEQFMDDILVAMGGYYELLYNYLKDGRSFDVSLHLGQVVRAIMQEYGYSYEDAKAYISSHVLSSADFDLIRRDVQAALQQSI